ncbi:MAG: EF-hand domain-containing protein [Planctomycetes bacterium]|nr:EF-hand domain-containing protein [Planctomycetota bacterium]
MITDLHRRKFTARFRHMDCDGSGQLTKEDFVTLAERLIAARPSPPTPASATRIREAYARMWEGMQRHADTDGDQRITLDEYVQACGRMVEQPERFDRLIGELAPIVLRLYDMNGDDTLSLSEFLTMTRALSLADDAATDMFRRLDRDGSGTLSVTEICAAVREFYLSADPNAPGNWFFGPY